MNNLSTVTFREYCIAQIEEINGEEYDFTGVPTSKIYSILQFLKPREPRFKY